MFFLLINLPNVAFPQFSLDIVYPHENQVILTFDSTAVLGSIDNPSAKVFVNDLPMKVYPNGAFLGFVPIEPGDFILNCKGIIHSDTVAVQRNIMIPQYFAESPAAAMIIDTSFILPQHDLELVAGDYLEVAFKGSPGLIASFSIPGLVENAKMIAAVFPERFNWAKAAFGGSWAVPSHINGFYYGIYKIKAGLELEKTHIEFLLRGTNGTDATAIAPGRLSVLDSEIPRIAEMLEGLSPSNGLYLPKGVQLNITGKKGSNYRSRLSETENVWIPSDNIKFLPEATPIPGSMISVIKTENLQKKIKLRLYLENRLPFKIEQITDPSSLSVVIYGATSNIRWLRQEAGDAVIRQIRWNQPSADIFQLNVYFNGAQQWGFNAYYDEAGLVLEIKKPPKKIALKNMLICIDPGHGPEDGAIGPHRLKEKDANLQLAMVLKKRLEKKGAKVYMTRSNRHGATPEVRAQTAVFVEADLLLSLHHNSVRDGVDPFKAKGSASFYYHHQSYALASAIQERLLEKLKLLDFGLIYAAEKILQISQMPAVMIKPLFITHPEEEDLLQLVRYQNKAAEAIVKGIEDFLKQAKE